MKIVQNNDDNAPQTHMNRIAAGEQLHWKYAVLYTMLGWVHWCSKVHCCTWTASAQFDALRPNPELLCLPYSWCLCFGTLHQQSHHTFSIRKSHTPTDKQTALFNLSISITLPTRLTGYSVLSIIRNFSCFVLFVYTMSSYTHKHNCVHIYLNSHQFLLGK